MNVSDQLLNRTTAGLVAVIIVFSSSIALIYQVVITLGGTPELVASLLQALNGNEYTEAAIITFLVTASDLTILSVGSAFWGILAYLV
jgi:predicted benzoate:H+ symporter BenE